MAKATSPQVVMAAESDLPISGLFIKADLSIVILNNGRGLAVPLTPLQARELAVVLANLAKANAVRLIEPRDAEPGQSPIILREVGHA